MKNFSIWATSAILLGVAAVIYLNRKEKKKPVQPIPVTDKTIEEILIPEVKQEEANKYTNAFLKQYEVVIPTAIASKRVREKAETIAESRRKINPRKVKTPIKVNEL